MDEKPGEFETDAMLPPCYQDPKREHSFSKLQIIPSLKLPKEAFSA